MNPSLLTSPDEHYGDMPSESPFTATPEQVEQIQRIAAQFKGWMDTEGWQILEAFIQAKAHACAEAAMETGDIRKWKGVRTGLLYFLEVINGAINKAGEWDHISALEEYDSNDLFPQPGFHGGLE